MSFQSLPGAQLNANYPLTNTTPGLTLGRTFSSVAPTVSLVQPGLLYLNRIYLSGGVYGVQTMSEHLYRKPASAVTLPEASLIAGLIQAPSTFSPWSNYEGALERSRVVLAQMRDQGMITEAQERTARAVRPQIQPYRGPSELRAAWAKQHPDLDKTWQHILNGTLPEGWDKDIPTFPAEPTIFR